MTLKEIFPILTAERIIIYKGYSVEKICMYDGRGTDQIEKYWNDTVVKITPCDNLLEILLK